MEFADATRLVEKHLDNIRKRKFGIEELRDAYEGEHKLAFASDEFQEFFAKRYADFSDNWCQVVADAPIERLECLGILVSPENGGSDEIGKEMRRVWQRNGADATSGLAFLDAVTTSRAYVYVWGDDNDPETPVISFESATECDVIFAPGSRRRTSGLKTYTEGETEHALLFTAAERVWLTRTSRTDTRTTGQWQVLEARSNPAGVVPIVEMANRPLLTREPISDIKGVLSMQHAINLLWSELFVTADYASFKQRVVLGAERPVTPILNDAGEIVGERPVDMDRFSRDRVIWIEDENAKIGEWSASNLEQYTKVIEGAVNHVAARTRTPGHYLLGRITNVSGDALTAAETGLVMRTKEKQVYFGQALREVFRLVALMQGDKAKADEISVGKIQWKDAESRSESQLVDAVLKLKSVGFPFQYLAERYGLSGTELDRVMKMIEDEQKNGVARLLGGDLDPLVGPKPEPVNGFALDGAE